MEFFVRSKNSNDNYLISQKKIFKETETHKIGLHN